MNPTEQSFTANWLSKARTPHPDVVFDLDKARGEVAAAILQTYLGGYGFSGIRTAITVRRSFTNVIED